MITNNDKQDYNQERWNMYEHIDRRIIPLSDKVSEIAAQNMMNEKRLQLLENGFVKHMEAEERVWEKITTSISDLKKVFYRVLWIGIGITGTFTVLWIVGKDVVKIMLGI